MKAVTLQRHFRFAYAEALELESVVFAARQQNKPKYHTGRANENGQDAYHTFPTHQLLLDQDELHAAVFPAVLTVGKCHHWFARAKPPCGKAAGINAILYQFLHYQVSPRR